MSLAACILGYGEVGLWLAREARRPDTWVMPATENPYQKWIDDYSGTWYRDVIRAELGALASACSPFKLEVFTWSRLSGCNI
jgi:hydroxymethylpyrimidine/phosphomethylpyrimidine kinase / thiaminase